MASKGIHRQFAEALRVIHVHEHLALAVVQQMAGFVKRREPEVRQMHGKKIEGKKIRECIYFFAP
ncbi:MAG TPA: hypothetical protein VGP68_24130 [Gemmataceae bacterium]|nr:hypothetical protein [Gemmataceae bacterium]